MGGSLGGTWGVDAESIFPLPLHDLMPLRGGSGLSIPVFGPLAQTSVLMPAWRPEQAAKPIDVMTALIGGAEIQPSGRRKPPKRFRVPGGRDEAQETGYGLIEADNGRSATLQRVGRSHSASEDGAAILADALLSAGILSDTDWCGGLERTISAGLTRWMNKDRGASRFRWFAPPLTLVLTDDSPAYSMGVILSRWRDHMRLPSTQPVGFFGLRFQSAPKPVHVRRVVQDVEAAFPQVGYGLMSLLQAALTTTVQGYTPIWGMDMAVRWGRLDGGDTAMTQFLLGDDDEYHESDFSDGDYHFGDCVPAEAATTAFRLDLLDAAIQQASDRDSKPPLLPVLRAAREVFDACRRAGKRFHTLNHCQFLSWQMSVAVRQINGFKQRRIERLDRAPVVYTVWDAGNDVMTRLVDDYTEFARSTLQYTDLSWLHCWQQGFSGREPEGAAKRLAAHDRRVKKLAKGNPDALSLHDPDYAPQPMPDGGIGDAVTALSMMLDILGATDRLLSLLHTPETLIEQVRQKDALGELEVA